MTRDEIIIKLKSSTDIPWYKEKSCLEAVKRNGDALQYVNIKTFGLRIEDFEVKKS